MYFADTKHLPYGNKTEIELRENIKKILIDVKKFFDYEIVVFACNTLTTSAINFVREEFKEIVFIGTEPATKVALNKYSKNEILIMATERTLSNLGEEGLAIRELATIIEKNLLSLDVLEEYLKEKLACYSNKKALVLGCTHYVAVKNIIHKIYPQFDIFDSNDGVMKRLKTFTSDKNYNVQFMSNGGGDNSTYSAYFVRSVNVH